MSSIIEGYNYDIFISYRQKDNKGDHWVSEFVEVLKTELESTFKEEISVYFDINPHDGLLETHDVDASLKEKLKCLIFIPIISRTYCDPKSFAWEHEFKAFVEMASMDKFGLKVKLLNGNVASRVLPIRIHDLDLSDIKECENLIGGVLRGIDFIYSEPGVNRPLSIKDSEEKNLNRTIYRNQVNKVSNSVREIFKSLQSEKTELNKPEVNHNIKESDRLRTNERNKSRKIIPVTAAICVMIAVAYSLFFRNDSIQKKKVQENRKIIVVLPFQNLTGDQNKDYWQLAIQKNITSFLSNYPNDIAVRQISTVNPLIQSKGIVEFSSMTNSFAEEISDKLGADLFVTGSFQLTGEAYRVNADLIEVETSTILKPFEISIPESGFALNQISDSLRKQIANFLLISNYATGQTPDYQYMTTISSEAYKKYIQGERAFSEGDFKTAETCYLTAIADDPDYLDALGSLCLLYQGLNIEDKASKTWEIISNKKYKLSPLDEARMNHLHAMLFEPVEQCVNCARQQLEIDDHQPVAIGDLGSYYNQLGEYDKAIDVLKEGIKMITEWKTVHIWGNYLFSELGNSYHETHQYRKERNLYKKAEKVFPEDYILASRELTLALMRGDKEKAKEYLETFRKFAPTSIPEEELALRLAIRYSKAGELNEAEKYYQKACNHNPENALTNRYLNAYALFLFDNKRNIDEGFEIIDKALSNNPGNSTLMDTKGWGLYKSGRYQEALNLLLKADSCKVFYNAILANHIDSVRNGIAALDKKVENGVSDTKTP